MNTALNRGPTETSATVLELKAEGDTDRSRRRNDSACVSVRPSRETVSRLMSPSALYVHVSLTFMRGQLRGVHHLVVQYLVLGIASWKVL